MKIFESILLFLPQHLFIYFLACGAWHIATDQHAVWLYKLFGKSSSRRSLQSDLCFVTRWKLICDVCAVWPACSITAGCVCVCVCAAVCLFNAEEEKQQHIHVNKKMFCLSAWCKCLWTLLHLIPKCVWETDGYIYTLSNLQGESGVCVSLPSATKVQISFHPFNSI